MNLFPGQSLFKLTNLFYPKETGPQRLKGWSELYEMLVAGRISYVGELPWIPFVLFFFSCFNLQKTLPPTLNCYQLMGLLFE